MAGKKRKKRKGAKLGWLACNVCGSDYVQRKPLKAKLVLLIGGQGAGAFCRRCAEVLEYLHRERDWMLKAMDETEVEGPDRVALLGWIKSEYGFRSEEGKTWAVDSKGEPLPVEDEVASPQRGGRGLDEAPLLAGSGSGSDVGEGGEDEHSTCGEK